MSDNRCVCCGEIIPEGRHVCESCERKVFIHKETKEEKFARIMMDWVYPLLLIGLFVLLIVLSRR